MSIKEITVNEMLVPQTGIPMYHIHHILSLEMESAYFDHLLFFHLIPKKGVRIYEKLLFCM